MMHFGPKRVCKKLNFPRENEAFFALPTLVYKCFLRVQIPVFFSGKSTFFNRVPEVPKNIIFWKSFENFYVELVLKVSFPSMFFVLFCTFGDGSLISLPGQAVARNFF